MKRKLLMLIIFFPIFRFLHSWICQRTIGASYEVLRSRTVDASHGNRLIKIFVVLKFSQAINCANETQMSPGRHWRYLRRTPERLSIINNLITQACEREISQVDPYSATLCLQRMMVRKFSIMSGKELKRDFVGTQTTIWRWGSRPEIESLRIRYEFSEA